MARPAIIAGLSLVLMETISDFGTVEFLAVETITLGIFNLWLGMNNLSAASQLSFLAFTFIVVLLGVELSARKNQKFNNPQASSFENKNFELGTLEIAKYLAKINVNNKVTIIGGGDTAAAVSKFKLHREMTHVSTGGGSSMELMSGNKLIAIESMEV